MVKDRKDAGKSKTSAYGVHTPKVNHVKAGEFTGSAVTR